MKVKICYDQACNDIGVVIATKGPLYRELFQNRSRKLIAPIAASMFLSLSEICESVIEIFWDEVFMVINTVKHGQS